MKIGMKIEIIDPDEVSASLLGEILSQNGHAVGVNTHLTRGSFASSDTELVITESETGGVESLDMLQAMRDQGHKAPWIIYR